MINYQSCDVELLTTLDDYYNGIEHFRKNHGRDPDYDNWDDVRLLAKYEIEFWKKRMEK